MNFVELVFITIMLIIVVLGLGFRFNDIDEDHEIIKKKLDRVLKALGKEK